MREAVEVVKRAFIESHFLDCNTGSDSGNAKLIRMPPIEQATNCRPFTA